jgi:outer membrane murein-binding lipoprotein Lpp
MTSDQIFTVAAASVPTVTVMIGILLNNSRLGDLSHNLNARIDDMGSRINDLGSRIDDLRSQMNTRFDDQRAMWQADLRRVEEVLDARLKHLEERSER